MVDHYDLSAYVARRDRPVSPSAAVSSTMAEEEDARERGLPSCKSTSPIALTSRPDDL